MSIVGIIIDYKEGFLNGLKVTLELCLVVWTLGMCVGTLLGVLGATYRRSIGAILRVVTTVLSGVPVVVLLFWLYYPMQQQLNVDISPFKIAVLALGSVNALMVADLVRNAIQELPRQYLISAKVSGLSEKTTLLKIKIPLIFKQLIGPILLVQISMLHNSIFASLINVDDIFRQIQRINAMVYKPIELYSALAVFFILVSVPLSLFANYLKKKYVVDFSER